MHTRDGCRERNESSRDQRRRAPLPCVNALAALSSSVLVMLVASSTPGTSAFCVMTTGKGSVHVCTNTSCRKAGSRGTLDIFRAFAPASVEVIETGCQGRCGLGPNVLTRPSEEIFNGVSKPATAAAIIEIYFEAPVADALVGAFGRVSEGDVFFQRGLHAEALACYNQCIDTAGAFEGNGNALSVAKVKQSSAMRMVAKKRGNSSGGGGVSSSSAGHVSATLEEAEVAAREAMDLWPANISAWLHLCDVLVDMGRVDEALETLDNLKKAVPGAKFEASEKAARLRNSQRQGSSTSFF